MQFHTHTHSIGIAKFVSLPYKFHLFSIVWFCYVTQKNTSFYALCFSRLIEKKNQPSSWVMMWEIGIKWCAYLLTHWNIWTRKKEGRECVSCAFVIYTWLRQCWLLFFRWAFLRNFDESKKCSFKKFTKSCDTRLILYSNVDYFCRSAFFKPLVV